MERAVITALADVLRHHVDLGKSRLETMALLTVGMIGARTVNLVHVADERGADRVDPASTYRRLQRFFQHVRLPDDWAAPMIARLAGGGGQTHAGAGPDQLEDRRDRGEPLGAGDPHPAFPGAADLGGA